MPRKSPRTSASFTKIPGWQLANAGAGEIDAGRHRFDVDELGIAAGPPPAPQAPSEPASSMFENRSEPWSSGSEKIARDGPHSKPSPFYRSPSGGKLGL